MKILEITIMTEMQLLDLASKHGVHNAPIKSLVRAIHAHKAAEEENEAWSDKVRFMWMKGYSSKTCIKDQKDLEKATAKWHKINTDYQLKFDKMIDRVIIYCQKVGIQLDSNKFSGELDYAS